MTLRLPAIEFAEKTDPGRDPTKQVNEDASGILETAYGHLCVVCDGMGGHVGGREASQAALAAAFGVFAAAPPGEAHAHVLRRALMAANQAVCNIHVAEHGHGRPGSTVVAILVHLGGIEVAHVGDSRVYWIHQTQITQVTKDHSAVQQMVDAGFLTPEEAIGHPHANQITRALGMSPNVEVDVRPQTIRYVAGDLFVLCTDGLSDLLNQSDILRIVGSAPPEQAVGQLVDLANARGGHDNITVQIIRTRETADVTCSGPAPTLAQTRAESFESAPPTLLEHQRVSVVTDPMMPAMAMPDAPHAATTLQAHPNPSLPMSQVLVPPPSSAVPPSSAFGGPPPSHAFGPGQAAGPPSALPKTQPGLTPATPLVGAPPISQPTPSAPQPSHRGKIVLAVCVIGLGLLVVGVVVGIVASRYLFADAGLAPTGTPSSRPFVRPEEFPTPAPSR